MSKPVKWRVKVEQLMACNCNWGCPCTFEAPPTYGTCEAALAYHIVEGRYGDTSLDDLNWVLAAVWPGPLHERNGRGVVYLDRRANPAQREALEAIATGQAGGPIGIFMSTVTAGIEVHVVDIEIEVSGPRSRFRVADAVEVIFEPIRNPVTEAEHHVSVNLPTGMLTKREHYYSAEAFSVNADSLSFAYPGRNAIASVGNWRGP